MLNKNTSSTAYNVEKLNDYNYRRWAEQMEAILNKREVWEMVSWTPLTLVKATAESTTILEMTPETKEDVKKRKKARALILSSILSGIMVYLRGKKTPQQCGRS
jgi:hypothetical protein